MNVTVFDVCDTLYRENTTFGFVRFFLKDSTTRFLYDRIFPNRLSPLFWGSAALYRFAGIDLPRRAIVSALAGVERETLRQAAEEYVTQRLRSRAVEPMHMRLRDHQARGERIILVSSSLDIVVEAISKELGVEWRSSRLAFRGDVCAGHVLDDLTGRKLGVVDGIMAEHKGASLTVYTDNYTDMDLVNAADKAVVVIHARGRRRDWDGVSAEFVHVG